MLIGASVQRRGGESWAQTVPRFEQDLGGKTITCARRCIGRAPTTWADHPAFAADTGLRSSWVSFKGNPTDAQLRTFIESIPDESALGIVRRITWRHEPENDRFPMTPAYFVGLQDRLYAAWVAAGSPAHVILCFILMGRGERPAPHGDPSSQWFPNHPEHWEMGIDQYSLKPGGRYAGSVAEICRATVDLWRAHGGTDWALTETGCHDIGADAERFLAEGIPWARSEGCTGFMWFDSNIGTEAPAGGWYLDQRGQAAIDAFAKELPPMTTPFPWSHVREDWENPNQTIDQHTRSGPFPWATADRIAIHYTAAADVPDGDPDELPWEQHVAAYLRAIQNSYVTGRGWSIGYGVLVTQDGDDWEVRGVRHMNASNLGWNHRTLAILMFVDGVDAATPAAVAKVRQIVAWFRAESPQAAVEIVGHQEIGATACPGVGLQTQIDIGVFDPSTTPPPPPPDIGDDVPRHFKFDPIGEVAPLFASHDGLTAVHVQEAQWSLLPDVEIEQIPRGEARRYTYVGGHPPDGYRGIWANA